MHTLRYYESEVKPEVPVFILKILIAREGNRLRPELCLTIMKQAIFILAAITAAFIFTGCNMMRGSGVIVETSFDAEGFKSLEAGSFCEVTLTEGAEYSVTISCDDNLIDYLDVKLIGDKLQISLMPYAVYNDVTFRASVVIPELQALTACDAADVTVSGFNVNSIFELTVSDAAKTDINLTSAGDISAIISGASDCLIEAESMNGNLLLICSDVSKADFSGCLAADADIEISGASTAWVNLDGVLSGTVSDASTCYYRGINNTGGVDVVFPSDLKQF